MTDLEESIIASCEKDLAVEIQAFDTLHNTAIKDHLRSGSISISDVFPLSLTFSLPYSLGPVTCDEQS